MFINVRESKFDSFSQIQGDLFRLKLSYDRHVTSKYQPGQ